ncbi:N-acetylmuramoyl-L-alanine amidase [Phormidesmis priestleyi ULC007]|uniref:N-acetylmuramoyl-L-alanine amidase n=1 Tax=Phormidesmis priestleyi ULC007 TaxID=1920490 RepID=A0A2T1DLB4_9CYAN|nr:N-acetylmuramoyl-L-alanine amidase [Phormidesmis priestleyi]PSB21245.1 N-acetylmuramoyl-L-alanine amidase [Phormidesmis priestleyi ULC007]PZO51227.1 MAG: N-acetylmuramoyl-L-alanine amidase [Phormidesmis priestleyi]
MQRFLGLAFLMVLLVALPTWASQPLAVAYPPADHQTTAAQIFLIGTAPIAGSVSVNGQTIDRSPAGHFAPSFPLQMGENLFLLRYQTQELNIKVTRKSTEPAAPEGLAFGQDSLTPIADIARLPGELVCFGAIAPINAMVSVKLADQIIPLQRQTAIVTLPENSGVLTGLTQPSSANGSGQYAGCVKADATGELGQPQYLLNVNGASLAQAAPGKVYILAPAQLEVAEVRADQGVARTGASTDYSRLTPLPKGTRATVTGQEGEWLRLDYGGWIKSSETKIVASSVPVRSLIRGVTSRQKANWTEILFPLQVPIPVTIQQSRDTFVLTLYNTTAQTDTIRLSSNPFVTFLNWQQVEPGKVEYRFSLKSSQQWGYKLRYDGTTLVLSLRNPPQITPIKNQKSLTGVRILLDPGHGGPEDLGSRGPTGYPEKDVALITSKLVRSHLIQRGATVLMTREADVDLLPNDRAAMIQKMEPAIAISLHYNALPDDGDAINTKGVAAFWYHPQAHDLAAFLHDYLVKKLDRPSYGVFWNNLALTRPTVAPSVLLELGFMINPLEFEWITNPQAQQKLALTLADGITEWLVQNREPIANNH